MKSLINNHLGPLKQYRRALLTALAVLTAAITSACSFSVPDTPHHGQPDTIQSRDASASYSPDVLIIADDDEHDAGASILERGAPEGIPHEQLELPMIRVDQLPSPPWVPGAEVNAPKVSIGSVQLAHGTRFGVVEGQLLVAAPNARGIQELLERHELAIDRAMDLGGEDIIFVLTPNGVPLTESDANERLKAANISLDEQITVSSPAMLNTMVVFLLESFRGTKIGLNPVLTPASLSVSATEGPIGPTEYNPDARRWSYLGANGPHEYGVVDAWDRLAQAGVQDVPVPVAVFDGGFSATPDLDVGFDIDPSADDVAHPDHPRHGAQVAGMIVAGRDDGYGVVGVASSIAGVKAYPLDSPTLLRATELMTEAVDDGARIVNLSWSGRTPSFQNSTLQRHPLASVFERLGEQALIVTSAGNSGEDVVDDSSLFLPCSLTDVLCIGGMNPTADERHIQSNYSVDEGAIGVDLFAPFTVFGTPEPGEPVRYTSGTSLSAAYVSGVAALAFAAKPDMEARDLHQTLIQLSRQSSDPSVSAIIAPGEVVRELIGNLPPVIDSVQIEGDTSDIGPRDEVEMVVEISDLDSPETCQIEWYSNHVGLLGTGARISTQLDVSGVHEITVQARDSAGEIAMASLEVHVIDHQPTVEVVHPRRGTLIRRNHPSVFSARAEDIDLNPSELPCEGLRWFLIPPGGYFHEVGTGCDVVVPGMEAGSGFLRIELPTESGEAVWLIYPFEVR